MSTENAGARSQQQQEKGDDREAEMMQSRAGVLEIAVSRQIRYGEPVRQCCPGAHPEPVAPTTRDVLDQLLAPVELARDGCAGPHALCSLPVSKQPALPRHVRDVHVNQARELAGVAGQALNYDTLHVYLNTLDELTRQITLHCCQRGELLSAVKREFTGSVTANEKRIKSMLVYLFTYVHNKDKEYERKCQEMIQLDENRARLKAERETLMNTLDAKRQQIRKTKEEEQWLRDWRIKRAEQKQELQLSKLRIVVTSKSRMWNELFREEEKRCRDKWQRSPLSEFEQENRLHTGGAAERTGETTDNNPSTSNT